jgi:hypothetical protein
MPSTRTIRAWIIFEQAVVLEKESNAYISGISFARAYNYEISTDAEK